MSADSAGRIPFVDLAAQRLRLGAELDAAIATVLQHGAFINGPEVRQLETELAAFAGAGAAVACSSGTDALLLPLMAWGCGPGDAVLVPAFTFAATAEVVALTGATPVFVDVDPRTFLVGAGDVEAGLHAAHELGLRPFGLCPVDLFGAVPDYSALADLARREGLRLLADAAQSFGAERDGRRVGTLGDATAVSFFPAKPLGCYGDGGAVLTDDAELAVTLRSLRAHGQGEEKYDNVRIGLNARLDTVQAAILLQKLRIFPEELVARQAVADRYTSALADVAATPVLPPGSTSAWAQYTLLLDDRDAVALHLGRAGVPTAVYYPRPLHQQTAYKNFPVAVGGLPVSERLASSALSLPMHPYLDPPTQDRIIEAVRDAVTRG